MPKGKAKTKDSKRASQKIRTARNQIKRYEKLLKLYPNDNGRDKWEFQINFFKTRLGI